MPQHPFSTVIPNSITKKFLQQLFNTLNMVINTTDFYTFNNRADVPENNSNNRQGVTLDCNFKRLTVNLIANANTNAGATLTLLRNADWGIPTTFTAYVLTLTQNTGIFEELSQTILLNKNDTIGIEYTEQDVASSITIKGTGAILES